MNERLDRQVRLREVGERGQANIERSYARVERGPAARIELTYLVRAGVERASIAEFDEGPFAHESWFEFSGPRDVARGASDALDHLLSCLELP